MYKFKSINKNTMCFLNVVLGIIAVIVFTSVLQGSSIHSLAVKELAIGSLFIGVLNVFLISFIGLLGKLRESSYLGLITSACTKYKDLCVLYTILQIACISLATVMRFTIL